jgi:hypothetical protein
MVKTINTIHIVIFSICFSLLLIISFTDIFTREPIFADENYNSPEKKVDIQSWKTCDNNYPDSIFVNNFTHSVNSKSIYEIKSGDSDDILNPNFVLIKEPLLEIGLRNVISFGINYSHIEGVGSKLEVKDDIGNTREIPIFDLKQLSYNDFNNSTTGLKTFYFLPYLFPSPESVELKSNYLHYFENGSRPFTKPMEGNLTISFAPDSETTVYYRTGINIINR